MCKRTIHGKPLPENLVFLGAVNPYRTMTGKMKNSGLTYHTDNNKSNLLVYTVNPLPHSLLNFVFYFGQLKPEDEQKYIGCIISQVIDKIYYDERHAQDKKKEKMNKKIMKKI